MIDMVSAISSSNMLTSVRPALLQQLAIPLSKEERGSASGSAISAGTPVKAAASSRTAEDTNKSDNKASVGQQQKTVVDQRTIDAGSVRVTVISYSDGSSEKLEQIKNVKQFVLSNSEPEQWTSPPEKGMMIDKLA